LVRDISSRHTVLINVYINGDFAEISFL